jgi:hypothetical protein
MDLCFKYLDDIRLKITTLNKYLIIEINLLFEN